MANTMLLIPPTLAYPVAGTQPAQHGGAMEPYFKETAGQSYLVGDLIYLDGNGTVAVCTTATVGGVSQLNVPILGLPDAAASGVTGKVVGFMAITPRDTFIMNAYHSTKASAVFAQTDLGLRFNIVKSAAGLWHVDKVNAVAATAPMVRVVGFPAQGLDTNGIPVNNGAVGDVYGLAYVQFVPHFETGAVTAVKDALQLWA